MSDPPIDRAAAAELPGTGRTEAFSDGVLAIAITLLVLNIQVPDNRPGDLGSKLLDLWPSYLAFLSSFIFIGVVWLNHHAIFRQIRSIDRALNWANLGLLLGAVVFPFPTAVLAQALHRGNHADERSAVVLYASVAAYLALSWWVFYGTLARRQHLVHAHVASGELRMQQRRGLTGMASYAIAGLVGAFVPVAALGLFVAMPIFYAVTSEGPPKVPA